MPCRYIVHSDDHNPYLASMEDFAEKLEDFRPDLLVVGGLQMMDNFPFQSGKRQLLTSFLFVAYFEHHHLSEFFLFTFHQYPFVIPGERAALLSRLSDLLSSSSPRIGVHFEMASFVEESIMEDLLDYVIPYVSATEQLNESMHEFMHVC